MFDSAMISVYMEEDSLLCIYKDNVLLADAYIEKDLPEKIMEPTVLLGYSLDGAAIRLEGMTLKIPHDNIVWQMPHNIRDLILGALYRKEKT